MRYDFLYAPLELRPFHHHAAAALFALHADVDAGPHHLPPVAAARMHLAETHHIPDVYLHR